MVRPTVLVETRRRLCADDASLVTLEYASDGKELALCVDGAATARLTVLEAATLRDLLQEWIDSVPRERAEEREHAPEVP